ncbi:MULTISPECIES: hypothetical protein [unclassified Mycolicibacterium]|uniref:hypothetical protein n=1 Tax=unclassified Mycolicibacterium TaxID=2636767 RepID=UPI001BB30A95|nr:MULTISPECIES: hypothetical protein [unclassified Mycolicibacterium]
MSQPPPPSPWGPQPPQQPGNWPAYPGGQPGPGPQGQWNPQQQWPNPTPAQHKKGPLKWILGTVALIAVVAVTVGVTVYYVGGKDTDNGSGAAPSSSSKSDFASANDTGPVSVITEDPSCAPWVPVNNIVYETERDHNWSQRDPSIPASAWTTEMRSTYNAVADAMRTAADQTESLVKITPHRVLSELYEQYSVYARIFIDHVPSYVPADNIVVTVSATISLVITSICTAISSGSATARGPLAPAVDTPGRRDPVHGANPGKFLTSPDPQCTEWERTNSELTSNPAFMDWSKIDSNTPASRWSPQEKSLNVSAAAILSRAANSYEQLARNTANGTIAAFGMLAAQYGRAFAQGIPTYTPADIDLYLVFLRAPGIIASACQEAGAN